jgi:hypothetical protein
VELGADTTWHCLLVIEDAALWGGFILQIEKIVTVASLINTSLMRVISALRYDDCREEKRATMGWLFDR